MNRHDGIRRVVLAGEKHADFGVLSLLLELLDLAREFGQHILAFIRQFGKRLQVADIPRQLGIQLDIPLQPAARLQDRLRFFLIVPEFRLGCFFFQLENLCALVFRIKDTLESAVSFPRSRSPSHEVPRAFKSSNLVMEYI